MYVLQHGNITIGSHCTLHNEKSLRGNLYYLLWLESNSIFHFFNKVSMSPKCSKIKKGKEIWSKILNIKRIYIKGTSSWLYIITVYTHTSSVEPGYMIYCCRDSDQSTITSLEKQQSSFPQQMFIELLPWAQHSAMVGKDYGDNF